MATDLRSLDDYALLVEIMESDRAVAEDDSDVAITRQRAASAEGDRRWGADALELSANYFTAAKYSSEDIVRMATESPDELFRIMGVTPAR
jgi:hypothetical protein